MSSEELPNGIDPLLTKILDALDALRGDMQTREDGEFYTVSQGIDFTHRAFLIKGEMHSLISAIVHIPTTPLADPLYYTAVEFQKGVLVANKRGYLQGLEKALGDLTNVGPSKKWPWAPGLIKTWKEYIRVWEEFFDRTATPTPNSQSGPLL